MQWRTSALTVQGLIVMQIYKVLPSLDKPRHMNLWHKAIRSQWSPEEIEWSRRPYLARGALKDQLARVISPVLMGEQAALYSVTRMIEILGRQSDTESQFYLTSMAMDEARHTELFSRWYRRLHREPLPIRRLPHSYLFQCKVLSDDPSEWLAGSLVSEVIAKLTLQELRRVDVESVLTEIATRVLGDEARHLAFNHLFIEDHFWWRYKQPGTDGEQWADHLRQRLDGVLETVPPMLQALAADLADVGIDRQALFIAVRDETRARLSKSIAGGEKLARNAMGSAHE